MTAPDPRLEEIEGRVKDPYSPESIARVWEDRAYLLAELRKAQDKLARVEGLKVHIAVAEALCEMNGTDVRLASVPVSQIRAAVADATGGGE